MYKRVLVQIFSAASIIFAGCASSKTVFDSPQRLTGEITVIGNEPFAKLAVRRDDGRLFLIGGSEEIKRRLLSNQGKIAELFYTEIRKVDSADEIDVTKVNILSK